MAFGLRPVHGLVEALWLTRDGPPGPASDWLAASTLLLSVQFQVFVPLPPGTPPPVITDPGDRRIFVVDTLGPEPLTGSVALRAPADGPWPEVPPGVLYWVVPSLVGVPRPSRPLIALTPPRVPGFAWLDPHDPLLSLEDALAWDAADLFGVDPAAALV